MKKVAKINLPQLVEANDYHTFGELQETINSLTDIKVKVKEIGFTGGTYVGVIYSGEKPDSKQIKKMLEEKNLELT